jgi:hypothetical protein
MNERESLTRVKRTGTAIAFSLYPIFAGFAFAVHPNLMIPSIHRTVGERIAQFHLNEVLHFGHFLMVLAVPLLIIVALHFMKVLQEERPWGGFIGGTLAIGGAIVLALDKGALCFVPSAFDTLAETDFRNLTPAIDAMFQFRGWLWMLQLLPLLPVGFIIQSVGLVRSRTMPRQHSVPILIGSIMMANPDVDIIGLAATIVLAGGFVPYAFRLIHTPVEDRVSVVSCWRKSQSTQVI